VVWRGRGSGGTRRRKSKGFEKRYVGTLAAFFAPKELAQSKAVPSSPFVPQSIWHPKLPRVGPPLSSEQWTLKKPASLLKPNADVVRPIVVLGGANGAKKPVAVLGGGANLKEDYFGSESGQD
jgi:hypothetical protein